MESSDMIELEKKRLEVVQRRQQKELEQLLNYEKRRQELKEPHWSLLDRWAANHTPERNVLRARALSWTHDGQ